nr:uncharacterized protein LOC104098298 [Nicotiana tomentosiformis]
MEYLSRTFKCMSELPDFNFYPMCKQLELTHLIFDDDLMMFCKGERNSVNRIMEAPTHFSSTSGLVASMEKSNLFLVGVEDSTKEQLLMVTGFSQGTFPIRYLGLPLSPIKWSKLECHQPMERITSRIRCGYAKQFSYAGRLQIINSIIFSIHSFWGLIFILPYSILKEVDQKCRDFLWGGSEEQRKVSLIAWDKICRPKKCGDLNIKACKEWNKAYVGKLRWQVIEKKDTLWVKWVYREGLYEEGD